MRFYATRHNSLVNFNFLNMFICVYRSEELEAHLQYHEAERLTETLKRENKDEEICEICEESFNTAEELKSHMRSHENSALYAAEMAIQCLYCGQICLGQKSLEEHVEQSHGKENRCPMCNSCFPLLEVLYQHFETQHLPAPSQVKSPQIMPPLKRAKYPEPEKAVKDKMEASNLSCTYCKREGFSSEEVLKLHIGALHEGKYPGASKFTFSKSNTCPYCNASYPTLYGLEEHMKLQHAELFVDGHHVSIGSSKRPEVPKTPVIHTSPIQNPIYERDLKVFCTQCKMSFTSRYNLAEHMSKVHPNNRNLNGPIPTVDKNQVQDEKEGSVLAQELRELKEQITRSNSGTPNEKSEQRKDEEKENIDTSEESMIRDRSKYVSYLSMSKKYGCSSCVKAFSKPDELQKHLMDIHAHHLYRCSLCKEIFDSKVNIQIHFAIKHSDEQRLYNCTACSEVFTKETEWMSHVKSVHVGGHSRFRCLFCQEVFPSEMDLQMHLTTHKKPFVCSVCNEAFHVEYLLDRHMEKHQLAEPPSNLMKCHASPIKSPKLASPSSPKRAASVNSNLSKSPSAGSMQFSPPHQVFIMDKHNQDNISTNPLGASPVANIINTPPPVEIFKGEHKIFASSPNISLLGSMFNDTSPLKKELSLSSEESQIHKCIYCNQVYGSKTELERHVKVHSSPSTRKCNICDEIFPSTNTLAEHKLQHCKVIQGNICIVCKAAMNTEEQFYTHTQQHGFLGANMQCIVCRQSLSSALELQMHGKHHFHNNYKYLTCCVCLSNFDSTENLISKLNASGKSYYICKPCYHGERQVIRCQQCDYECDLQADLDTHMDREHKKKSYQCIKCQSSFASEYEIQLHVASHVMTEGNVHECKICRSKYDSPAKLQCHLIEHSFKGKQFQCYLCGAGFDSATTIQQHAIEHGVSARQYSCPQCPQKFFFSAELKHHTLSHNEQKARTTKPFSVPSASKTPVNNKHSYPMITKLITSPDKKLSYKCDLCPGKTFAAESDLKVHTTKVHDKSKSDEAGKQKFPCPQCDREFPSLSALQGHTWVHNSGKTM